MNNHKNKTDNAINLCKIYCKKVRNYRFYNYIERVISAVTRLDNSCEAIPMVTGLKKAKERIDKKKTII